MYLQTVGIHVHNVANSNHCVYLQTLGIHNVANRNLPSPCTCSSATTMYKYNVVYTCFKMRDEKEERKKQAHVHSSCIEDSMRLASVNAVLLGYCK